MGREGECHKVGGRRGDCQQLSDMRVRVDEQNENEEGKSVLISAGHT